MTKIQILYTGPIVKRAEAISLGLKRYFTGKPCKYGHVDQRRVGNFNCMECESVHSQENIEARRAAKEKWRRNNPDKQKESEARYRDRNREKILDAQRAYRKENPDARREVQRKWRKNNPEAVCEAQRRYRRRKINAEGSHTLKEVMELLDDQGGLCACCGGVDNMELDHIVPLSKGGGDDISNLQWLCMSCNRRKSNMMPDEWERKKRGSGNH